MVFRPSLCNRLLITFVNITFVEDNITVRQVRSNFTRGNVVGGRQGGMGGGGIGREGGVEEEGGKGGGGGEGGVMVAPCT